MPSVSANLRPILGRRAWDGSPRLWRSNIAEGAGAAAADELHALAIGAVVDLRMPSEVAASPHPLADHVGYQNVPLHTPETARPPVDGYDLNELYWYWATAAAGTLRAVAETIAALDDSPALVCCAAGKDRTGIVCGILSGPWGADAVAIGMDYAASGPLMRDRFAREMASATDRAHTVRMHSSAPEVIHTFLDRLMLEHHSVAGYLAAIGVNEAAIEALNAKGPRAGASG